MSTPGSSRAPLLWLLLPFMAGLVLADLRAFGSTEIRYGAWVLVACAVVAVAASFSENRGAQGAASLALLVGAFVFGCVWLPLRSPPRLDWKMPPREVNVLLQVEQVYPPPAGRKTFNGVARVVGATGPAERLIGQRVHFSAIRRISVIPETSGTYPFRGVVEPVPRVLDGRSFERYLESLGVTVRLVRGQMREVTEPPNAFRRFCNRTQDRMMEILRRGLEAHPSVVGVYQAMLLGEKAVLEPEQENAFMRSGVFHIFSVSGLHVGVIALALTSLFTLVRVPRREGTLLGLAMLWLYVQITGASVPAERAFLMIAFFLSARIFRWPGNGLAALAAAGLVTLLIEPRQLFTAGFQMSYSVVAALLTMGTSLSAQWQAAWQPWKELPEAALGPARIGWRWLVGKVLTSFAITLAATLASTPSSIGNFGLFSPGALIANLLVVPAASLAIVAGFVSLVEGLIGLAPVCVLFNHAAAVLIRLMDLAVRKGSTLPGMYFEAEFGAGWMSAAAIAVVIGAMLLGANRRWRAPWGYWLPFAALGLVIILGVKFG